MAGGRSPRPRQERAITQDGTEGAGDVLTKFREALPDIAEKMVEDAKTDSSARAKILDIMQDDMARARAGRATELFVKLEALRAAGSEIEKQLWNTLYKNGLPVRDDLKI